MAKVINSRQGAELGVDCLLSGGKAGAPGLGVFRGRGGGIRKCSSGASAQGEYSATGGGAGEQGAEPSAKEEGDR